MATFLKKAPKYKSTRIHYQGHRNFFTGSRYSGYVNYFHNENLFGFVVREDAPEREYYFHVTDLHAENIPRVRPLQPVEFSIIEGRGGNFMARDISSLGGQPIRYSHANMKMKEHERNRNLSELPNSELERHSGVVVSVLPSGKGGLIVPDRLNFGAVGFATTEIQSTGAQRLERFSEIEFYARPSKRDQKDRGVCITRRGNGLITAERRNTGHSRRLLGAMYGPNDIQAQIPKDFSENRRRGYIINYSREKLYGFIAPFDVESGGDGSGFFVHIDDCHIYGARFLKRFEEVEFSVVTDAATGKSKALHVSGPNKTVLRSVTENRYLPTNLTNTKLTVDENARYRGSVMITSPSVNWFIIKPDMRGYEAVIAYKNNIQALGMRRMNLDDCVEFNVAEPSEQYEGGLLRAVDISAPSGRPLLCELGPLGKYLQTKMNLAIHQSELPEYDITNYNEGTVLNGFITNYSTQYKFGKIEIESPDANKRYRRCFWQLDDAVLPEGDAAYGSGAGLDLDRVWIRDGTKVQFELKAIDYSMEFQEQNRRRVYDKIDNANAESEESEGEGKEKEAGFHYEDVVPIVHIKAVNIMSQGLDFLEVSEATQQTNMNMSKVTLGDDDMGEGEHRHRRGAVSTGKAEKFELDVGGNEDDGDDKFECDEDSDDEPLFGGNMEKDVEEELK